MWCLTADQSCLGTSCLILRGEQGGQLTDMGISRAAAEPAWIEGVIIIFELLAPSPVLSSFHHATK